MFLGHRIEWNHAKSAAAHVETVEVSASET
jgi:hypothetical protein